MRVRFGAMVPLRDWAAQLAQWRRLEGLGWDVLWSYDHLASPYDGPDVPQLDGWAALAGLAALSQTARVGMLVTHVTYRHPVVIAKTAATVDHISEGRLELGLGPGGSPLDHAITGQPYWPVAERVGRFREAVEIVRGVLDGTMRSFAGDYYAIEEPAVLPLPRQRPLPITLATQGPRTMPLTARYAQGWNTFGSPRSGGAFGDNLATSDDDAVQMTANRIALLKKQCDLAHRDVSTLRLGVYLGVGKTDALSSPASFERLLRRYIAIGINEFVVPIPPSTDSRVLDTVSSEVLPALRNGG